MGAPHTYGAMVLGALVAAMHVGAATARAQVRLCPQLEDQRVLVEEGRPTAFRVRVTGLGDGDISIFQFPLRGILQQAGPTPLDFVFVPAAGFNGTTEFAYRVIPPADCDQTNVLIGRVTLAGGTAPGTAVGLAPPPGLCGIGPLGLALLGAGLAARAARAGGGRRRA